MHLNRWLFFLFSVATISALVFAACGDDDDDDDDADVATEEEATEEEGEATEEFNEQPKRADGGWYVLLVAPVGEVCLQSATTVPAEDLLCRM